MAEVYTMHAPGIHALAHRFLRDPGEADEVVQETFLKAFRHLEGFREESKLSTWLYQIALNACRSRARKPRPVSGSVKAGGEGEDLLDGLEDRRVEVPSEALARGEMQAKVKRTLDALPEHYKEILVLALDRGLSYGQVARLTGRSEDEVRGVLYRARIAFRKAYGEEAS